MQDRHLRYQWSFRSVNAVPSGFLVDDPQMGVLFLSGIRGISFDTRVSDSAKQGVRLLPGIEPRVLHHYRDI